VAVLPCLARAAGIRLHRPGPAPAASAASAGLEETPLSARQLELLALLGEGLRQREAAERLGLSIHQVGHLLRDARERAGAGTRELVARFGRRAE
ncbi:MAG: hypothetical protein J0H06_13970, partial [Actinobacteria bacterium]|nr:hypothetical protein [Actinomycetota bacterium]